MTDISGGTHVNLQEFIEKLIDAKLETLWRVLAERKDALDKTEIKLDTRLHDANQLQNKLDVMSREMLSVSRFEREHKTLEEKLQLERDILAGEIRGIVKDKIDPLVQWHSTVKGRTSLANIVSIIAVVISLAAVVVATFHLLK